jgi:hypothetical protein
MALPADEAVGACGTTTGGLPSLWDGLNCDASGNVHLTAVSDVFVLVGNLLRILIALSGALAVIMIIVAAIYYVTSMGDPGRVKRAKDILTNLVIGLVLLIGAYAVVDFVTKGIAR